MPHRADLSFDDINVADGQTAKLILSGACEAAEQGHPKECVAMDFAALSFAAMDREATGKDRRGNELIIEFGTPHRPLISGRAQFVLGRHVPTKRIIQVEREFAVPDEVVPVFDQRIFMLVGGRGFIAIPILWQLEVPKSERDGDAAVNFSDRRIPDQCFE